MSDNLNSAEVLAFFAQRVEGLETYGSDGALGFCPYHDDRGGKKKSFSIQLTTSRFRCHSESCRAKGNATTFARKFGLSVPGWAGGVDYGYIYSLVLKNDRTVAREYLLCRGIPLEYVDYLDEEDLFGFDDYKEESWISFPVFSPSGGIVALNKVNLENGDKRTFGSYVGGYWIDTLWRFKGEGCLVEGVINAITLNALGYPAMSILTSGNSFEPEVFKRMHLTLALDNDVAGRKASRRLSRELEESAKSIRTVDWPPETGKGFDPNDVLQYYEKATPFLETLIKDSQELDRFGDLSRLRKLVNDRRK